MVTKTLKIVKHTTRYLMTGKVTVTYRVISASNPQDVRFEHQNKAACVAWLKGWNS